MLTQARLQQLLRYAPRTGVFYWRIDTDRVPAGTRAGTLHSNGYWQIQIDGRRYLAHRLAWLYVRGRFPNGHLDHKNRNKLDCRIGNLREASQSQNNANAKRRKSESGYKGVTRNWNNWMARVVFKGKTLHVGTYKTPKAAHAAYCKAAKELHGKFFHNGKGLLR